MMPVTVVSTTEPGWRNKKCRIVHCSVKHTSDRQSGNLVCIFTLLPMVLTPFSGRNPHVFLERTVEGTHTCVRP